MKHSSKESYDQFFLLLHKDLLLQKRKLFLTAVEIFLPIVFGLILLFVRSRISSEFIPSPTTESAYYLTTNFNYALLQPPESKKWVLAYCPDIPKVRSIVKDAANKLNMSIKPEYAFNNEEDLERNLTTFNEVFGAVVFVNESFVNNKLTPKIQYKIRLRAEQYAGSKAVIFRPRLNSGWLTQYLMPPTTINGPRQKENIRGGSKPGYYKEGFLTIQQAVDVSIMKYMNANVSVIKSFLKKFPFPPYFADKFVFILQTQFPFIIMLCFSVIAPTICSEVTFEKEHKLKEAMKLMGMKGWVNWLAWFTKYTAMMLVSVTILTTLFYVKIEGASVITYTHPTITFIFLFLYTLNIIMFCFFVTTLFKKASTASAVGTVSFLITYFPHFYLFFRYDTMCNFSRMLVCLVINLAMCQGCRVIAKYEEIGVGVQWSHVLQGPNVMDGFSMAHVFFMQLFNLFFYGVLTWYIDAVRPGEYGTPKPWNFIFSRDYWRRKCRQRRDHDETVELMLSENLDQAERNDFFEKMPADAKIGIRIRNLTKMFPNSPTPAVNSISLDMKEGDITALLGHNGAGKTTTMSILTGFLPPTSGSASINGLDIEHDMEGIRRSLGLCPQFNILFDSLTVREHLVFFAKLKRCPSDLVGSEAESMILRLGLLDKTNTASKALSGGMKRKLCVGIALIAGSKCVILDEPSSGLDPEARRQMWSILKSQKQGRTMILSTHYMDEADYLGDRIAIMADGRLHCCGSSMFLKKKYGVGYHMTLVKTKDCDPGKLDALIHQYIPNAKLENAAGAEMSYILPKEDSTEFAALFSLFEEQGKKVGVDSFGASVTTIEEVFIKVKEASEKEAARISEMKYLDNNPVQVEEEVNKSSNSVILEFTREQKRKEGADLKLQQVKAMLVKRMLNTWRNRVVAATQFLTPIVFCIIAVMVTSFVPKRQNPPPLILSIDAYPSPITYYAASSKYVLSSGRLACLEDVINQYKGSSVFLNNQSRGYFNDSDMDTFLVEQAKDSFYLYRNKFQVAGEVGDQYIKGFYNDESFHTIAMSLSMVNNAWLKCLINQSYSIVTINHPLPWSLNSEAALDSRVSNLIGFIFADLLMFGMAFLIATFIVFLIQERTSGAKSSQYVSGVTTGTFWFATFIWDYFNYLLSSAFVIVVLYVSKAEGYTQGNNAGYIFLMLMFYGWGVLPTVYLMSFMFKKPSTGYVWTSVANYFTGTAASLVIVILKNPLFELLDVAHQVEWAFYVLFPNFCLEKGIQDIFINYHNYKTCSEFNERISLEILCPMTMAFRQPVPCCLENCGDFCLYSQVNYLAWEYPGIGRSLFFLTIHGLIYFSILILFESDVLNRIRSALASHPDLAKLYKRFNNTASNSQLSRSTVTLKRSSSREAEEDGDVKEERKEVLHTALSELQSKDIVLFMKNLVKVYSGNFTAVDNLCLKVSKGECFGLLGVNGAGKTSTFKMMTGDETISGGDVYINAINVAKKLGRTRQFVGYCPQFDALIDQLTTKENLVMHARLRGMYPDHIEVAAEALMKRLMLSQYKNRLAGKLSGGNKRKLGIAIALIGDPLLVFLDEPSAGMDPVARRELWNCVSAVREAGNTVILTSHSMEECEALCTRLAIMVNGQFKCLGSCQHLKSKFSSGYSVVLKVSTDQQDSAEKLHQFMSSHYPGAYVEYEGDELIGYRIEKDLVNASLAKIFEAIEAHKKSLMLEDYSVGQTSLEQVFINFVKSQKEVVKMKKKEGVGRALCCRVCCCCNG